MNKYLDYNITKYINSITEVNNVNLESILRPYSKCKQYQLSDEVSEYIRYIEEEPFYIPPSFSDVKTDIKTSTLEPKFVLLSAPGATGKSSLAKYIAYRYDAIYWNLSKIKIGSNCFAGSILKSVGPSNYSQFIKDLNDGNTLLIIDAFDEAEIISGRKMISDFIWDINNNLNEHQMPTVFLLARTETAQYIASFCAENAISLLHYEIGFFNENSAKDFIVKSVVGNGALTPPDIECANKYYTVIKDNITVEESSSFLGYAPVLEAISTHIKSSSNRQRLISTLSTNKNCVSIIMSIMNDLLIREQNEKVVLAFKQKSITSHPDFCDWEKVYSSEEQMVRIIYYILFQDTKYNNYTLDFLPDELINDYQYILDSFLPQHPFVRTSSETSLYKKSIDFTGPAFRDYVLANILLNKQYEPLADTYFEESQSQSYFPSQIFFDFYMEKTNCTIKPNHISYVYDSFRAKATAYEHAYLNCIEHFEEQNDNFDLVCETTFGMSPNSNKASRKEDCCAVIYPTELPLEFEQLINVFVEAPNMTISIGHQGMLTRIYNSSVVCKNIVWSTNNITIESYEPEGCLIVAKDGFSGNPLTIDISKNDNLNISSPNIDNYYRLIPYKYNFDDTSKFDNTKFIHSLRCILSEFRTHRKDTLAKTADRIDRITVGSSKTKQLILDYLKSCNIIYRAGHLYKINEILLKEKGIFFDALLRMDIDQISPAFEDFCKWLKSEKHT